MCVCVCVCVCVCGTISAKHWHHREGLSVKFVIFLVKLCFVVFILFVLVSICSYRYMELLSEVRESNIAQSEVLIHLVTLHDLHH